MLKTAAAAAACMALAVGNLDRVLVSVLAACVALHQSRSNIIALLYIASAAYTFWEPKDWTYLPAGTLLKLYLAWQYFSLHIQNRICTLLYVEHFKMSWMLLTSHIEKSDICKSTHYKKYTELQQKFYIDEKQSYSILRALLRVSWMQIAKLQTAKYALIMLMNYQNIVRIQIIGTFANGSSGAYFNQLVLIWLGLHLFHPFINFVTGQYNELFQVLESILKDYFIKMHLQHKCDYNESKFNLNHCLYKCSEYANHVRNLIIFGLSVLAQVVRICILSIMLGWVAFGIVISMFALLTITAHFKDHYNDVNESYTSTNKATFTPSTLLNNMRVIKQYGWESKLLKLTDYNLYGIDQSAPMYIRFICGLLDRVEIYGPKIIIAFALLYTIGMRSNVTYVELSIIMYQIYEITDFAEDIDRVGYEIRNIKSIESYLERGAEFTSINYVEQQPGPANTEYSVELDNCSFSWGEQKFALQPITLKIPQGAFVAIQGQVGSGKSSLLAALCCEMPLVSGQGYVQGSIGYVSQKPWIMNATFRENVLFGSEYDEKFYMEVIRACALEDDIEQLADRDLTEIGHKGINLSGGQKVRLALARAVYSRADIYVLDDVLSAVDSHVEKHLVENVLTRDGILKSKTRILVTHADHILPLSDVVITMVNGAITSNKVVAACPIYDADSKLPTDTVLSNEITNNSNDDNGTKISVSTEINEPVAKYTLLQLIGKFIKLSGYKTVGLIIGMQFVSALVEYYLTTARANLLPHNSMYISANALKTYLMTKLALDLVSHELDTQVELFEYHVWRQNSAHTMAADLAKHLAFASLTHFEQLPKYALSGLFDNDIVKSVCVYTNGLTHLPFYLFDALVTVSNVLFRFKLLLVLAVIPVILTTYLNQIFYSVYNDIRTRLINKQDAISENIEGEVIQGQEVIRIHQKAGTFLKQILFSNADSHHMYRILASFEGLFDIAHTLIKAFIALAVLVYLKYKPYATPYSSGEVEQYMDLCTKLFNSLMTLMGDQYALNRYYPMLFKYFAYSECIEQEASHVTNGDVVPQDWPRKGVIEFDNYSLRYRDELDVVLQNLTFTTKQNEKVGIVGRTGAGKSSLSFALLRLVEAASGSILIDGVDISQLGLSDLRSQISMVPQDPMLFKGTIRDNLDPGSEYSDEELLDAISKAHINNLLNTDDSKGQTGLLTEVEDNGQNFSVGQRQLISLCRALLWKRKIVILDEATANIDTRTDQLMQTIIRQEFSECTVLTIAHRLKTVMDSDRIMVMDQGRIAEFDTPSNLLAQPDSQFSQLVESMRLNESQALSN